MALLQLSAYSGHSDWHQIAEISLSGNQDLPTRYPTGFSNWLSAADFALGPIQEVALVGSLQSASLDKLHQAVWRNFQPNLVLAVADHPPDPHNLNYNYIVSRTMDRPQPMSSGVCLSDPGHNIRRINRPIGGQQMNQGARREAILQANTWLDKKPIYLDTETTGTGRNDSIIEISIVDQDGAVLVDTLVKPVGTIPPDATAIHGITNEMVRDAPSWDAVWPDIESVLLGRSVGVYNVDFDLRMLQQTHQKNWLRWSNPTGTRFFCIMKLYAQFFGEWNARRGSYRWHSLDNAGKQCGISLPNSHRAKDDTLLTRELLQFIAHAG